VVFIVSLSHFTLRPSTFVGGCISLFTSARMLQRSLCDIKFAFRS